MRSNPTLADAAHAARTLATCSKLLIIAGLDDVLGGTDSFTVFAPTDKAFSSLAPETLDDLMADPPALREMLMHHIVPGSLDSSRFMNTKLKTLRGTLLAAAVTDDGLTLDYANTCDRQVMCANGVIHPIDAVLIPDFKPEVSARALEDSAWSGRSALHPSRA